MFEDAAGEWRVAGEPGRVYAFAIEAMADGFADRLGEHGIEALVLARSASQVADLLVEHDLYPASVDVIEAQTLGVVDAVDWTLSLADRLVRHVFGDVG